MTSPSGSVNTRVENSGASRAPRRRFIETNGSLESGLAAGWARGATDVLLFDRRVVVAVAEVAAQHAQPLAQMNDCLRVNLRHARFGNVEDALDFLERLALEIVELDDGSFLLRERFDRADERFANLTLLDVAPDVFAVTFE